MPPKRREIHWCTIPRDSVVGTEQFEKNDKVRPWLIVSDDRLLQVKLVIACPITSGTGLQAASRFHVPIDPGMVIQTPGETTPISGLILCEQVRAMSIERFAGSTRIGKLATTAMQDVERVLGELLGLGL